MMQQTKALETWVGLFVAIGFIGLFFLSMKVSNLGDLQIKDDSYRLIARFENAGSLRERAPVSMGGVRVGRVSSIRFDKNSYQAVVEMRIDPEFDTLPEDTTATVLTAGLLGEQYIGLSAGGSPEFLKDGDEIELTQSAMILEQVISRFLFNKAAEGSEKEDLASSGASEADTGADTAIAGEGAPPPRSAGTGDKAAAGGARPKPKRTDVSPEASRKPNAASGKPANEAQSAPKKPRAKDKESDSSLSAKSRPAPR